MNSHGYCDELNENEQCTKKQCCVHNTNLNSRQDSKENINSKENISFKDEETFSFRDFFKVELTRGYLLENDEERYSARRQKIYSFMRIPRDLERFMVYGIMQCADSFLYIHTFLPVRFILALCSLLTKFFKSCFGIATHGQCVVKPAEICDLLKCTIWIIVTLLMISVDTNRVYHIIKSQSIIKLYIFYNMLEVGDRLLSAFGQDTIDALFWTATEPKHSKREHFGLIPHIMFALIYVILHSFLIMFQATTLNVAVNSNNKGLLTIMISNNFVELKGSVFKKFDKNNLFQLTCSDVRERFHLSILLFIVIIQTMKEFDWNFSHLTVMLPDCFAVFLTEILIDWIKHAFITRFNEIPEYIYREYTTSLAYDMTQTRQKHAFSDHSDLVARRMGFIPFPLGVVLIKAILSAVSLTNLAAWILVFLSFLFILALRILLTICALGKACELMKNYQEQKCNASLCHSPTCGSNKPFKECAAQAVKPSFTSQLENTVHLSTKTCSKDAPKSARFLHFSQESFKPNLNILSSSSDNILDNGFTTKDHMIKIGNKLQLNTKCASEVSARTLLSSSNVDVNYISSSENILKTNLASSDNFKVPMVRSMPNLQQHIPTWVKLMRKNHSECIQKFYARSESEPNAPNMGKYICDNVSLT